MSAVSVGSSVRLREAIIEHPDGDSPGCICGKRGDTVIVRKLYEAGAPFLCSVSHEGRNDNSFAVTADEIELIDGSGK